jgi:nicotinamide-nucleotide amidase
MHAEILAVGTELSTGQAIDTNGPWLSQRLAKIGIDTLYRTIVPDDLHPLTEALRSAAMRASVILISGGLGPTQDDLTREAIARVANVSLVEDPVALEHIQAFFANRGRAMPERNRLQALRPEGAELLANPIGTAPGLYLRLGPAQVFALPGVPQELRKMFQEQVLPRLQQNGAVGRVILFRTIHTFGWGESAVEEKILDLTARGRQPEVGITVSEGIVSLRIIARAANVAEAQSQIATTEAILRERLGPIIFGCDEQQMEDAVVALLQQKKHTLAVAESITGGLVSHRISRVPGASLYHRGGIVSYTDEIKHRELNVPWELLREHTAVSAPVARAMAEGVRQRFGVDLGLATTGFAGPTGGTVRDPIGTAYVALSHSHGTEVVRFQWGEERIANMKRTANAALNLLRLHLINSLPT